MGAACVLLSAASIAFLVGTVRAEAPVARIGFLSDTHVSGDSVSCAKLAKAYDYFRGAHVDVIVNCGDIADRFLPEAYRNYADVRRRTYPESTGAPCEIFVYAGHDAIGFPSVGRQGEANAFAAVRSCLGINHAPWDRFEIAGFTFLVFPQFGKEEYGRYERAIAAACAASSGKPVFVVEHVPGAFTTQASNFWGDEKRRSILSHYPQVVAITGHAHGSMYDERNLWQGDYTSVNVAGMTHYRPDAVGVSNTSRMSGSVICADLYADRIVFRRRDIVNDCDCGDPWTLLFANRESMTFDRRFTAKNAPVFAEDAALGVDCSGKDLACVVNFPAAKGAVRVYRMSFARKVAGGWQTFSVRDEMADYDVPSARRKAHWTITVPHALFDGEDEVGVRVEPLGFGSFAGLPLSTTFVARARKLESAVEVRECRKVGQDILLVAPGFSKLSGMVSLVLELSVEQPSDRAANLRLTSGKFRLFDKMLTPAGNSTLRYAFDVSLPRQGLADELRLTVAGCAHVTVQSTRIVQVGD